MTWIRRGRKHWHYQVPDAGRFVCGAFFEGDGGVQTTASVPSGVLCRRCERLLQHAFSGVTYRGQIETRASVRRISASAMHGPDGGRSDPRPSHE